MTEWKWHFDSPRIHSELGGTPEMLLDTAELVKFNPVRKVLRTNGLYLKLDSRPGRHLRREWASACLLKKRGIPAVEHLAIGTSPIGELLITRELKNSVTLRQRVHELEKQDRTRLRALANACAEFTRKLLEARIFHPDYHAGNILVIPEANDMALVDVCEVRSATLWDRLFRRSRMEGILRIFILKLTRNELLDCLAATGSAAPEKSFRNILANAAAHCFHSWPKRRSQILAGHHRYTVSENGWLRAVDNTESPLPIDKAQPMDIHGSTARQLFLAHFLLQMAAVPHRDALAFNPKNGTLLCAPLDNALQTPKTLPLDVAEVMAAYGWTTTPEQWRIAQDGTPFLADLTPALKSVNA